MKALLLALAMGACFSVQAQGNANDALLKTLSNCDAQYFEIRQQHAALLQEAGYQFDNVRRPGRLIVPNPRDVLGTDFMVLGTKPIGLGALKVVGQYELQRAANTFDTYDWGLLVAGDPHQVVGIVNAILLPERRLTFDGMFGYARLETLDLTQAGASWAVHSPLPSQAVPKAGMAELVMEVTLADESLPGVSRVGCSLQGRIPKPLLQQVRPDISSS
jgi:hypothetical protein